jgi:hypothetical protein
VVSSRLGSPDATGRCSCSLFAAWFPGGATISRPYISCTPAPLRTVLALLTHTAPHMVLHEELYALSSLHDAVLLSPLLRCWERTVCPHAAQPCVASFPPGELPPFTGTTRRSDSPCAIGPSYLLRLLGPSPIRGSAHGASRVAVISSCHACHGLRPRGSARHPAIPVAHMLTSACATTSSFPTPSFEAQSLQPCEHCCPRFTAYGLHACGPTLEVRDYSPPSKDSLPGGWPALPGRVSRPLDIATLPGRTAHTVGCCPLPWRTTRTDWIPSG